VGLAAAFVIVLVLVYVVAKRKMGGEAVPVTPTAVGSEAGASWTPRTSGTDEWLFGLSGVTYGNGTFAAVGADGTILTSP